MKKHLVLFLVLFACLAFGQTAWINEIHYDDGGSDANEMIEVVINSDTNPTADLANYTVQFYNGSNGTSYQTHTLDTFEAGTVSGDYYIFYKYTPGIQNGAPDGIALGHQTLGFLQFLSYEGTLTASGGIAADSTSTDIGVAESGSTLDTQSLQLTGSGSSYADFTWTGPTEASAGLPNAGQTLGGQAVASIAVTSPNSNVNWPNGTTQTITWNSSNYTANVKIELVKTETPEVVTTIIADTENDGSYAWDISASQEIGTNYIIRITGLADPFPTDDSDTNFEISGITNVTNLAALRALIDNGGDTIYRVTGEVVVTAKSSYRNQMFIQDESAAVLIDDPSGVIATSFNIGDGITGLTGTLSTWDFMIQFTPAEDPVNTSSTGNTVVPQVITLNELNTNFENYEAELIKIQDLAFTDAGNTFASGNLYTISDGTRTTGNFFTKISSADYIGTTIPAGTAHITGVATSKYNSGNEVDCITARSLADIEVQGAVATIVVSAPTAGSSWVKETTNTISFITANIRNDLGIELTENGNTVLTIGLVASDATSYEWTIPASVTAGNNYKIKVIDIVNTDVFGYSETFSITEPVVVPNLVITEIMKNPSAVSDNYGEYFEIYNPETYNVNLAGYTIKDADSNIHVIPAETPIMVNAGSYFVFGINADTNVNGGVNVDYEYPSTFNLGNGTDEVIILDNFSNEVDRVYYSDALFPDTPGVAMMFMGNMLTDDNNDGSFWLNANTAFGAGDYGTPGSVNLILTAPANVTVTKNGSNIDVSWNAVNAATSYTVYVADEPNGEFIQLATGVTATNYSHTGAASAGKKFYKVTAVVE